MYKQIILALLFIAVIKSSEEFESVIQKGAELYINEHVYEDKSIKLRIKGYNMEHDDKFKVTIHYKVIDNKFFKDVNGKFNEKKFIPIKDLEFIGTK